MGKTKILTNPKRIRRLAIPMTDAELEAARELARAARLPLATYARARLFGSAGAAR